MDCEHAVGKSAPHTERTDWECAVGKYEQE